MTDGLIAFLRARLDEDERVAHAAAGVWESDPDGPAWMGTGLEVTPHVLRHDPARALREVEAKRVILGIHDRVANGWGGARWAEACAGCGGEYDDPITPRLVDCPHLRAMAAVYADHPDYREEWRP